MLNQWIHTCLDKFATSPFESFSIGNIISFPVEKFSEILFNIVFK